MKISLGNNNTAVQSKIGQEIATEATHKVDAQENKKDIVKSKRDSTEISSSHNTSFEDSRLDAAKSAILCDVTVKESDQLTDLKEAVNNGTYYVPSDVLAEEILK